MNKMRRKAINQLVQKLNDLLKDENIDSMSQIIIIIEDIVDEMQTILDDEETYFYNIPENLQSGLRYDESEKACDNLEDAISQLEDISDEYRHEEIQSCILSAIRNLKNCI